MGPAADAGAGVGAAIVIVVMGGAACGVGGEGRR